MEGRRYCGWMDGGKEDEDARNYIHGELRRVRYSKWQQKFLLSPKNLIFSLISGIQWSWVQIPLRPTFYSCSGVIWT